MSVRIYVGDCRDVLETLPDESVQCVITSPPYFGLRDYGLGDDQLGLEATVELYTDHLVSIFEQVRRVLRADGVAWLNLGDSYASRGGPEPPQSKWQIDGASNTMQGGNSRTSGQLKPKDLIGALWRVAFALQAAGWWLRSAVTWIKANTMPESVTDRPTTAHEYWFLLAKSEQYFYDADAVRENLADATIDRNKYKRSFNLDGQGRLKSGGVPNTMSDGHEPHPNPNGRNRRTSDGFNESLDLLIDQTADYLAHLRYVKENSGMLLDEGGDPLALLYPTKPFPEAHFATFSPDLIEPLIKSSSSERGCCPACGAAWERVVKTVGYDRQRWSPGEDQYHTQAKGKHGKTSAFTTGDVAVKATLGWRPACGCEAGEPVACTVLDPFAGAGTAGLVADRLGRDAILIELNEDYAEMARRRIEGDAPMFTDVQMFTNGAGEGE